MADRQNLVVQLAGQHNIAGYEMTPMEDEKVNEFVHQLSVAARKADSELNEIKVRQGRAYCLARSCLYRAEHAIKGRECKAERYFWAESERS